MREAKPNCSSFLTCPFLRWSSARVLSSGPRNTTRSNFTPPPRVTSAHPPDQPPSSGPDKMLVQHRSWRWW